MPVIYSYDLIGWGFMLLAIVITLFAQARVSNAFRKYKKVETKTKLSGVEVARKILDANGLTDVYVTEVDGILSDHYDPSRKVVRLSHDIFHGTTVASNSVAAHECGHAIQDRDGYRYMRFRSFLVPFVNLSSKLGYFAILIGFLFSFYEVAWIGVVLECVILLFQLVTLPVEFDASNRAEKELKKLGILNTSEMEDSKKMLNAAAFTYVASLATTLLELLRLVLILIGRDDNR